MTPTAIPYATEAWPIATGCSKVSDGCLHCYACRLAATRLRHVPAYAGLASRQYRATIDYGSGISTEMTYYDWCAAPRFHPEHLDDPLHWRKPRRVFVAPMSDLLHEAFTDEQIERVLLKTIEASQHRYLILTKRIERAREFLSRRSVMPWVWLGVSVESQEQDWRIVELLRTPAALRFVSYEPALGSLRLGTMPDEMGFTWLFGPEMPGGIDWVILGGESGPGARPMQPEWALNVYRQCKAARVPFFWKQEGSNPTTHDLCGPDGRDWVHMIQTRELPEVTP